MMCRKQVTLMLIVAVTARALPIADPKTDHITPINTDLAIQPEINHSGGETPIISEKIPSTYTIEKEVGEDVEVEPKPYKTPEVDSVETVVSDVEPVVAPAAHSSFRANAEEEVEAEKAPTLSIGDIGAKDPVESPNLHKVVLDTESVPHEGATSTVIVDDEATRDEKVPDGVEQYGSALEFSKYDTNSDGVIDIDEWSTIHGSHEKINGQFHAADINGDKQLEEKEFQGASWYHDGDQGADIARDALMLAIAEQAATAEHNHAMAAAVMPSTELRYIVDDAQSVPVIPAEPVAVVPEKSVVPSVNVDAADFSIAPPKGVAAEPAVHSKDKTEVPQVAEVLKYVQPTDTTENTSSTSSKPAVTANEHGKVTPAA
ncbi:uncharacterized protein LOC119173492 [Rhipicephalus microplus]|uniref:uncharacterized protein LOC119173492 n=1 Tax=Rhipicephalus microplus TaxID=6941 RepID=UPI002376AEB5